jgi:hypothetical protein
MKNCFIVSKLDFRTARRWLQRMVRRSFSTDVPNLFCIIANIDNHWSSILFGLDEHLPLSRLFIESRIFPDRYDIPFLLVHVCRRKLQHLRAI